MPNKPKPLYAYIGACALLLLVWYLLQYINDQFQGLAVHATPRAAPTTPAISAESLYPVWVSRAHKAIQGGNASDINDAFGAKKEVAPVAVIVEPDYGAMLKASVSIDAIGADGAFINGQFYRVGEKMVDMAYATAHGYVTPALLSVTPKEVVISIPGQKLAILAD